MTTTTIGIIGCGYWGPNLLRNFAESEAAEVRWISDLDAARLAAIGRRYPGPRATLDYHELLADPKLDAVVLATPVATHFPVAREALLAGKHVLIEKPLTTSVREA
jgi:predicted dehydrogenase